MTIPTLTQKDFERLRADPQVRKHLRPITPDHSKACGCYLLMLPVWMFTAFYGGYALDRAGLYPGHWLFFTLLALAVLVPLLPIFTVRRHMRRPVLDRLAETNGLDYASHDFELKGFEAVRPILFGEESSATLTDLLASDEGGKAWAVCHAELQAGDEAAYTGLLYWFAREGTSEGAVTVLPAAAAAGAKPPEKMQAVVTGDGTFDASFAAFAVSPDQALKLLDEDFRRLLLSFARECPPYLHLDREECFLAAAAPDSFESRADSSLPREERLRAIFDNVRAALENARAIRSGIDARRC